MKVSGDNPETGEHYESDQPEVNEEYIESMSVFDMADDQVRSFIDNLDMSADIKSLLYKFSKATIRAGEMIFKVGRKILDYIMKLLERYPNATFGLLFGAIAGFLISTIPIVGIVLGPLVKPIAMALGMLFGAKEDIKDKNLVRDIARANASFAPLGA